MAHHTNNNNDTRRRTMEVSATMLRDILIGYKEDDIKENVSLDEELNHNLKKRSSLDQTRPKNRAKSEDKSRRLKDSAKKENMNSLSRNSSNKSVEPTIAMACINHTKSFSSTSRQQLHDSSRIKNGRRYSPRQGSTGSDASNKSHSEDSIGSEGSTSKSSTFENFTNRQTQNNVTSSLFEGCSSTNPSANIVPPILTSSPLIERKTHNQKPNGTVKKGPILCRRYMP